MLKPQSPRTVDLFDTGSYPIHEPDTKAYRDTVNSVRASLESINCARLRSFVLPEVLQQMQREGDRLGPCATYTRKYLNPYFSIPDEDLPGDHPLNRYATRMHGMVRGDKIGDGSVIRHLFQNPDLCRFVADCLGYDELFTYRDPFGCVNINVQPRGCEFPWHFDHNEFTVSFGLKRSAEGGCFEYVPDIRTDDDENYDAVKRVLDGEYRGVRRLNLQPGDLQLFKGAHTLHRVTAPVDGERQCLLLGYVRDPAHIATREYAERLWGESHPMHRD